MRCYGALTISGTKQGTNCYAQGIKGGHVYTIRAGCVKMVHALDDGGRRIVRLHYRGDAIGLQSVLGQPHRNSAIVLQKADICRIPVSVIHALKQRNPQIYEQLMRRWQSQPG